MTLDSIGLASLFEEEEETDLALDEVPQFTSDSEGNEDNEQLTSKESVDNVDSDDNSTSEDEYDESDEDDYYREDPRYAYFDNTYSISDENYIPDNADDYEDDEPAFRMVVMEIVLQMDELDEYYGDLWVEETEITVKK